MDVNPLEIIDSGKEAVALADQKSHLNTWVADAPYVWLPGVLVQAALWGHLVIWRKLRS